MKCPLNKVRDGFVENEWQTIMAPCLKEECAWWSEELAQCDPTGMLPHIIELANALGTIADKMPHEEQFRR